MAGEQHPLPNAGALGQGTGVVAAVKGVGTAVRALIGSVDALETRLNRIERKTAAIRDNLRGAAGARPGANGNVGSSGNNIMPNMPTIAPAAGRTGVDVIGGETVARPRPPQAGVMAGSLGGVRPPVGSSGAASSGWTPQAPPAQNGGAGFGGGLPPAGGGGTNRYDGEPDPVDPHHPQAMYGGSFRNYMSHLAVQSAPFVLPQAIARMTGNVRQYAEAARGENYLANRFSVGSTVGAGGTARYERGMYSRMALATFGGAENAEDRQQGLYTLHQNFSTQAIFGAGGGVQGGGVGGGATMAGQMVGLSQANPGMGAAGAARQLAALNNPGIINMARAYGVQLRQTGGPNRGAVNFEAVANDLIDRMYGPNPTADETDVAYSFQPGNASYANLQQMGFDEETISNVQRIVQGRARTGWGRAQLGDSAQARDWRRQAGLGTELSQTSLTREGERAKRDALTTRGEVGGLVKSNELLGEIHGTLREILAAVQPLTTAAGGVGGFLGGTPAAASAVSSGAGLAGNFMLMRGLMAFGQGGGRGLGMAAASGLGKGIGGLLRGGIPGLAGGLGAAAAGSVLGSDDPDSWRSNRWAKILGQTAAGAGVGAGAGALFGGIGAVPGALFGAAGGLASALFAAGGVVPGDHNNDTVDIKATPGEVVVPTHTVKKHGGARKLMQKLGFSGAGRDDGTHYAKGGEVYGGVKPHVAEVGQKVASMFGVNTIHGVGQRDGKSDHPVGLALDFMAEGKQGDKIADWFLNNMGAVAAKYVIWKQRINKGSGWKKMEDRGSRTANHFDHVHVSFNSKAGSGAGTAAGAAVAAGGGGAYDADFYDGGLATSLVQIMRSFGAPKGTTEAATSGASGTAAGAQGAPPKPTGNVALGKSKAAKRGWTGKEWDSLYQLWQKESGWRHEADNPTSSAYGIPQALIALHDVPRGYYGTKTGSGARTNAKGGDPGVQIDWGLDYIQGRYGTPSKAWSHHAKKGSYSEGAWRTKTEVAQIHEGEMLIPAKVAEGVRSALREDSVGQRSNTRAGGTVNIYLTVQKATDAEARRFAGVVKRELESDDDLSQVAMS